MGEEEQIAMALQISMQCSQMKETNSRRPNTAASDDMQNLPMAKYSKQVHSTFLEYSKNAKLENFYGPYFLIWFRS